MRLEDSVAFFTEETSVLASLDLCCGSAKGTFRALGGVRNLAGEAVTEHAIYDLASLTKLFTGVLVMRLHEQGRLDLESPVTGYAPMFSALSQVSVDQILGFEISLQTPERVDQEDTPANAKKTLFACQAQPHTGTRMYSDMHAMVLRYVLEGAGGLAYMDLLRQEILEPLGIRGVYARIPAEKQEQCVSCDREHRIEGTRWILREGIAPGTPHDPKCRALMDGEEQCAGHAGLFADMESMVAFAEGMLAGKILSRDALRAMARNRTGKQLPDGRYTQYLGSQCYVRHPQQVHSEVPVFMSDHAMAVSGFTGHHLSLDPESGCYVIALGNRVLNRLTVVVPETGRQLTDYGLDPNGRGSVIWPDGECIPSSVHYVYLRDAHMHRAVADTIGCI